MDEIGEVAAVLATTESTESKIRSLAALTGRWFSALQAAHFGDKNAEKVSAKKERVQLYYYSWHALASRGIPFDLWSDIAEEGLALLRELVETGDLDYEKHPKYPGFIKKVQARVAKVSLMPEYSGRFEMGF